MTSLASAHSSVIDTCIFPENNFFKRDLIGQNRSHDQFHSSTLSFVVVFLKVPSLFDRMYNRKCDTNHDSKIQILKQTTVR